MPDVAGSVVIQIGGDISAFEAALAKARQQAVAFDASITAQLSGAGVSEGLSRIAAGVDQTNALLSKLTTSGAAAGATMTKLTASTLETTAALAEVTAATTAANAELSTLGAGGGAGLAAGTIAAKDFAAALEATGGRLDRITPAMLGLATETEAIAVANRSAATGFAGVATGAEAVGAAGRTAAGGMAALGAAETEAAGMSAQVTREFTVLGSEVARGNFSRIPGSLLVLNERLAATGTSVLTLSNFTKMFGSLAQVVFNPYVLGFLAISIGTEVAVKAFEKLTKSSNDLKENLKAQADELNSLGKAYSYAADQAKGFSANSANGFGITSASTSKSLQLDIATQTKTLMSDVAAFITPGKSAGGFYNIDAEFKPFSDAIAHLRETAAAGTPDILGFKKMVEDRWALDPNNAALTTTAGKLESLIKPALEAAVALEQLKIAQDQMRGRGDEGANMIANTIAAGNAAADALKKANENFGTSGLTAYQNAISAINQKFDDLIVKAHASGAALDTFNQARGLETQEANLKALSSISFDQPIAGANAFGAAITSVGSAAAGVKVELGGMAQPIVNITRLFGQAKLDQLIGIEQATQKLEGFKTQLGDVRDQLDAISNLPTDALFGAGDKGTQADITDAYNRIDDLFKRYDSGTASVKQVHDAIEQVRASLIALGGDNASVNEFVNAIINGELKVRQLTGDVQTLGQSISSLPNKTVTITVKTQQVGSGTQSLYDVGGGSTVGVTRYGATPGQQSGPSITSNEVPRTSGYGSLGGGGDLGSTNVTVTRFATGGVIHPGDTQQVSFFKSPDETVAIFTPQQRAALANPQSGFTGTQPTSEQDRYWVVLMNIEAATQKTAQLLDEINAASKSSSTALGGSSSSSSTSSSGVDQSAWNAAFDPAYKTAQSNYYAAMASFGGGGSVLYPELAASPREIAANVASMATSQGGTPQVGGTGATSFERDLIAQANMLATLAAQGIKAGGLGFASGGMLDAGDTQKVEFFKSPSERVIIARPDQFTDARSQAPAAAANSNDQRPITINQTHNWNGNAPPSQDSIAEMRRQTALAVRQAMREFNGRG